MSASRGVRRSRRARRGHGRREGRGHGRGVGRSVGRLSARADARRTGQKRRERHIGADGVARARPGPRRPGCRSPPVVDGVQRRRTGSENTAAADRRRVADEAVTTHRAGSRRAIVDRATAAARRVTGKHDVGDVDPAAGAVEDPAAVAARADAVVGEAAAVKNETPARAVVDGAPVTAAGGVAGEGDVGEGHAAAGPIPDRAPVAARADRVVRRL